MTSAIDKMFFLVIVKRMKKFAIIGVVVLLLLLLGGGLYLYQSRKANLPAASNSTSSNPVFSSIQDALNRSLSLKCQYSTGDVETIAYIKNGEIRSDITSSKNPEANGSVIIKSKDKKIYFWNAQKTGFVMTLPDATVTPTGVPSQGSSAENSLNDLEKYKQNCKVADVDDSLFTLPTDVKFTDTSELMKALPTTPAGSGSTGGYTIPTQYQQYMQK